MPGQEPVPTGIEEPTTGILHLTQVKMAAGAEAAWKFPQLQHNIGETMRAAAERVLQECTQPQGPLQTFFLGNGPIGHVGRQDDPIFFHKAQLIKGDVAPKQGSGLSDYAWLNRDEVIKQETDSSLRSLLEKIL